MYGSYHTRILSEVISRPLQFNEEKAWVAGWVSTSCNGRIFYVEALHAAAILKQTVMPLTDKEGAFKIKLLRRVFRRLGSRRDVSYTHNSSVYKTKNYYILLRVEGHSIIVLGICFER
jgi:hypothetical protein